MWDLINYKSGVLSADREKFRGYICKITSPLFILNMELLLQILEPLAALSCSFQEKNINFTTANGKA